MNKIYKNNLERCGAVASILFPISLIIAFSMHFMGEFGFKDFFNFEFSYTQPSAERFMELFKSERLLDFALPHALVYLTLPLLTFSVFFLGKQLFESMPKLATIGVVSTITGTIFMGGIFGSWLSFMAITNVNPDQVAGIIPAIEALIQSKTFLAMTGILVGFSLIGFLIISAGLFYKNIIPRWQSSFIFIGNLMIILFMDLDNLMLIGSMLWFIGILPLSTQTCKRVKNEEND
jgi:hypothetical protein